jgi:hypothetical protein
MISAAQRFQEILSVVAALPIQQSTGMSLAQFRRWLIGHGLVNIIEFSFSGDPE